MNPAGKSQDTATTQALEIAIRLSLVFLILAWCLKILTPFISVIAWGAIIAIAIYPLFLKLTAKLGGSKKLAVTLIAVISIAAILIPVISLSGSLVESATRIATHASEGTATISPPTESVKEWPLIGEKTYAFWQQASVDLSATLEKYPDQLSAIGKKLLTIAASVSLGILQFIISMLIASVFLVSADAANASMQRLARRLSGDSGEEMLIMSANTVRSVAVGVIGIAFIQAMLAGLGMMFAGVPAAGLLALVILVLGIAQLPPLLVLLPVMIYLFSGDSTTVAIVFSIWGVLVSFSDVVLKPLLLGRGVDAPMLVILLGAIGGMITSGIVGLFIGAVILAIGYKLFQAWVEKDEPDTEAEAETKPVET
jgi:predicted PurR-regulated permease PerM